MPIVCTVPSGWPSPPSWYQSVTITVFWKTTSLCRFRSTAAMCALLCIMKLRPSWPEELARPSGCSGPADPSSSAAEFAAPADTTNRRPCTVTGPSGPTPTASTTRRPEPSVTSRSTRTPVANRADPVASAGSMARTSASDLAPTRHGNPSQVAHRRHAPPGRRSTPIAVEDGLTPAARSRSTIAATYGSCGSAAYGKGVLRHGSVGSSPVVPCTAYSASAAP